MPHHLYLAGVAGEMQGRAAIGVLVLPQEDDGVVPQVGMPGLFLLQQGVEFGRVVAGGGLDELRQDGSCLQRRLALVRLVLGVVIVVVGGGGGEGAVCRIE